MTVVITNFYPDHFHWEPVRVSLASAGYTLVSIAGRPGGNPKFDGTAAGQLIFNYPMDPPLVDHVLRRRRAGERLIVLMDDPLAFFDQNINVLIEPILKVADRVFTSSDNMLPIYRSIGVQAELLVGLANPLFDVALPPPESEMEFDWGFIGRLIPQRFRFFWQLERLLPGLRHYVVTEGFGPDDVRNRVRRTRCNITFGNYSDVTDFKAQGTTLRSWEFPYAGGFLIQDRRPLLSQFFKEGESMITFETVEECSQLIRFYLDRPEHRQRIAQAARLVIDQHRMIDFLPSLYERRIV